MNLWQKYYIVKSIEEALEILEDAQGEAKIIAGGTDLLLDIQQGRHPPVHTLIDINNISELKTIEIRGGEIFIGAAATHKQIATSPLILDHCFALATASKLIGGPQVRNTATIGGNVAHALPAADGTIALVALDARAEIATITDRRWIGILDLFSGPGKSTLKPNQEILTGFYLNARKPGQASSFNRIMRPQGVAIAILNMAIWLQRNQGTIAEIRISVGPSGPVPRRMIAAERAIRGCEMIEATLNNAYQVLLEEAIFRTSKHRSTKEYRQKMACVLLEKTLQEAFDRSQDLLVL